MSLFDWLLVGHLVGDYLFQNGWMATNKTKRLDALVVHSTVYTIAVFLTSLCSTPLNMEAVILVFSGHVICDQGAFIRWWTKHVQRPPVSEQKWLTIMADQSFHLIILGVAAWLIRG